MQANQRDNRLELAVRSKLHCKGFRFRKHYRPFPKLRIEADMAFPRRRIAVFLDGCFWHGCPAHATRPARHATWWAQKLDANSARDRRVDAELSAIGWTVLRYWEHDGPASIADAIARFLVLAVRRDVDQLGEKATVSFGAKPARASRVRVGHNHLQI
jgi:DNA mismatch endonuclease, patch repair protein